MEAGLGVSGHGGPFGTGRTFPKAYQYRPVKIIIRVPRYTILPLAEGYAIFNPHLKILLKKLPVFLISILSLYTQEIM